MQACVALDMHWFNIHNLPKKRPPPGLFSDYVATDREVHALIASMFGVFDENPHVPREVMWTWCQKYITRLRYDEAAFFTLAYYADLWLSQREQNEHDYEYAQEDHRINRSLGRGDPRMYELFAAADANVVPSMARPSLQDVGVWYEHFKEDQRIWKRVKAERIRKEAEEAKSDEKRQAKHETLKEEARAAEAERRRGLLTKNQERLAKARAAEREAEQRALDEKRRREQAAALRAEQRKQKDEEQQQASSEASGVSDDALRAILAEQEALERAAAAQGQGSSAWHASAAAAAPSPEEEARMRAEAEAAEQQVQAEKDAWIAKAAQKREAKQAKKRKGKGKAPAAPPAPALPVPPRMDWDEAMANAMQRRLQLQDRQG